MLTREQAFFITGKPFLPKEPQELKTGQLTVQYENGSLRTIKYGSVEIIRMIYSAVRDHNWGTIEPVIRDEIIEKQGDSIIIRYTAEYNKNDIAFTAEYSISITGGIIRFTMRGQAGNSFKKNRIGFCVLHPIKECMDKDCIITHPDGSQTTGIFPQYISPHQPFKNIQSMRWQPEPGINVQIQFHGDIFETEDQRNWGDASYKTYCTPLEYPFPVLVQAGQAIEQTIELCIQGQVTRHKEPTPGFIITKDKLKFPAIGVGASFLQTLLDSHSISLLRNLNMNHYRVDVFLAKDNWPENLRMQLYNAKEINTLVEVVLHVNDKEFGTLLTCLAQLKDVKEQLACITVLNDGRKVTDGALLERIAPLLRREFPNIAAGAGTDCFFAELNRERTPIQLVDYLTFSLNPQVHAFDNKSLNENLQSLEYVVQSAKKFTNNKRISISPVTLKMRFNPNVTGLEAAPLPGELPSTVDARQMSLYGAAWTLGCIKHLAQAGAAFITLYETVGWRGLLQGDQDSPLPERFPVGKGQVFPIYQIFKWILDYRGGNIIPVTSTRPLLFDGLLLEQQDKQRLIVANYSQNPQTVQLPLTAKTISVLNEHTVKIFFHTPQNLPTVQFNKSRIELLPCAVACVDF